MLQMSMYDLVKRRRKCSGVQGESIETSKAGENLQESFSIKADVSDTSDEELDIGKPVQGLTGQDEERAIEVIKQERPDALIVRPSADEDCTKVRK